MEVGFNFFIFRRPEKRRAPISVDHKLRKHALDFWTWTKACSSNRHIVIGFVSHSLFCICQTKTKQMYWGENAIYHIVQIGQMFWTTNYFPLLWTEILSFLLSEKVLWGLTHFVDSEQVLELSKSDDTGDCCQRIVYHKLEWSQRRKLSWFLSKIPRLYHV